MEEFQIFTACKTAVIDPRIIMGEVEQNADSLELIYLRSAGKAPALHLLLDLTLPAIRGRKAEHILVKADINLVKSIEARRSALIQEAEAVCQKDLKQVWADKQFHETMLAHISAVFGLVEKAMRCTSDSEMILTALQSIRQLRMIKEREWDAGPFVKMVASVPSFKKENISADSFGEIVRVVTSRGIQVTNPTQSQNLYNHLVISVTCSPVKLVDGRSKRKVNVGKAGKCEELEVVVLY